jgi:glutamate synthase domain-containing protein 1
LIPFSFPAGFVSIGGKRQLVNYTDRFGSAIDGLIRLSARGVGQGQKRKYYRIGREGEQSFFSMLYHLFTVNQQHHASVRLTAIEKFF